MKMRMALTFLAVVFLCLAFAGPAGSVCTQSGAIVYSYISSTATPVTAYFYLGSGASPTVYYYGRTADPDMIRYLASAQAGQRRVTVTGKVATCPTTGTTRNMGVIQNAVIYSKY